MPLFICSTDSGPQVAPPSPLLPPSSLYLPVLADLHQNYQSTNHAQQNTCGEDNSNLDGWFKSPMSYGEVRDITVKQHLVMRLIFAVRENLQEYVLRLLQLLSININAVDKYNVII